MVRKSLCCLYNAGSSLGVVMKSVKRRSEWSRHKKQRRGGEGEGGGDGKGERGKGKREQGTGGESVDIGGRGMSKKKEEERSGRDTARRERQQTK